MEWNREIEDEAVVANFLFCSFLFSTFILLVSWWLPVGSSSWVNYLPSYAFSLFFVTIRVEKKVKSDAYVMRRNIEVLPYPQLLFIDYNLHHSSIHNIKLRNWKREMKEKWWENNTHLHSRRTDDYRWCIYINFHSQHAHALMMKYLKIYVSFTLSLGKIFSCHATLWWYRCFIHF